MNKEIGKKMMFHYYLSNNSHIMDAVVRNSCEKEFLAIIRTLSEELKFQVKVEVQAREEGGIVEWYKFIVSNDSIALVALGTFVLELIQLFLTKKSKLDKEEQRLKIEYLNILIDKVKNEAKEKRVGVPNISEEKWKS